MACDAGQSLWARVRADGRDFNAWTTLITIAEKADDLQQIRQVYEGFLEEFPLCYVYWKKYADHELRAQNDAAVTEIFERAVTAFPSSVDLWTYYCTFVAEKSDDLDQIRSLFERALAHIKLDFFSHILWDKYLEFELSQQEFALATVIFHRALDIPLLQSRQYWERYLLHASTRPTEELLLPGRDAHSAKSSRASVLSAREERFKKVLAEVEERLPFERIVQKRPFFHVKPLEEPLLENWHRYLSFALARSELSEPLKRLKVKALFERCLIACCGYVEFWRRYVEYLEDLRDTGELENARAVLARGATSWCRHNVDIGLEYAVFEEAHGHPEHAREQYKRLVRSENVQALLRYAHFELRQKQSQTACNILQQAIKTFAPNAEITVALSISLARIHQKSLLDNESARKVYTEAVERNVDSLQLWIAFVNFELSRELWTYYLHLYSEMGGDIAQYRQLEKRSREDIVKGLHSLKRSADTANDPFEINKLQRQAQYPPQYGVPPPQSFVPMQPPPLQHFDPVSHMNYASTYPPPY